MPSSRAGLLVLFAVPLLVLSGSLSVIGLEPQQTTNTEAIVPFKIRIPNETLADLKARLNRARFPDELSSAGWDYGTNLDYLKGLVAYWRDTYDWRQQERLLNQLPQFKTRVDGLDIHFVHRRSSVPNALPVVFIHGWPGSFIEFTKITDLLVDPVRHGGRAEDAFHVVAISLPGYGFSDKPRERRFTPERMAAVVATVMQRLGYQHYGIQGGDWGSVVGRMIALNDAGHVAGLHLNFCTAGPPPGSPDPNAGVPATELARVRERQASMQNELAYFQIQSTKPQTLGYGLNDSPIGLAAWIVEKFRSWCDCGGDVERKFTKDELLTNITIYWVTQTIASSTRIYYENQRANGAPRKV
jgi:pimeloyl-ACP methyl ester carboxylesterase